MDDLTKLKDVGKAIAAKLATAGITTFAALAAANAEDLRTRAELRPTDNVEAWIAEAAEFARNSESTGGGSGNEDQSSATDPAQENAEADARAKAEADAAEKAEAETRAKALSRVPPIVLLADCQHGRAGEVVKLPPAVAAELRRARLARRMVLSDLPSRAAG